MVYLITISGKVISYGLEYVKEKLFTKYQYNKSHSVLCNKSNTKMYSHVSQLLMAPLRLWFVLESSHVARLTACGPVFLEESVGCVLLDQ